MPAADRRLRSLASTGSVEGNVQVITAMTRCTKITADEQISSSCRHRCLPMAE